MRKSGVRSPLVQPWPTEDPWRDFSNDPTNREAIRSVRSLVVALFELLFLFNFKFDVLEENFGRPLAFRRER